MKPPRSKKLSPLGKYLWNNRLSNRDFAASMQEKLHFDKFSPSTVEKWRYGQRYPKGANLAAVILLTGLTAGQILGTEPMPEVA